MWHRGHIERHQHLHPGGPYAYGLPGQVLDNPARVAHQDGLIQADDADRMRVENLEIL